MLPWEKGSLKKALYSPDIAWRQLESLKEDGTYYDKRLFGAAALAAAAVTGGGGCECHHQKKSDGGDGVGGGVGGAPVHQTQLRLNALPTHTTYAQCDHPPLPATFVRQNGRVTEWVQNKWSGTHQYTTNFLNYYFFQFFESYENDKKKKNMWVQKLVQEIVEKICNEVQKPETQNVFQIHVLDPIIQYALGRLYPYILATSIVFFLTFILAIAILYLLLTHRG
jgi:hypothetical protein